MHNMHAPRKTFHFSKNANPFSRLRPLKGIFFALLVLSLTSIRLHADTETLKWNMMPKGSSEQAGSTTFEARNISNKIIKLTNVSGDCSCLELAVSHKSIEPGQTSSIRVTRSRDLPSQNLPKKSASKIIVSTSEGEVYALDIVSGLAARKRSDFVVMPSEITWEKGNGTACKKLVIRVLKNGISGLASLSVAGEAVSVSEVKNNGQNEYTFQVCRNALDHISPLSSLVVNFFPKDGGNNQVLIPIKILQP